MASIALSVLVMCQLFCFVVFFCRVCVATVWTIWSVLGVYFIFVHHCLFHFCVFSVFLGRCERVAGYVLQV